MHHPDRSGGGPHIRDDWHMKGVNLDLVGLIFMIVGLIGVVTFSSIARRRRVVMPPSTPVIEEERHHRGGYGV